MRFYGRRGDADCAAPNPVTALGRIRRQGHNEANVSRRRLPVVRKLTALIAVIAALGLAACGDDDESEDTTAAGTATEETATTEDTTASGGGGEAVDVVETDFEIDPAEPTVAAGTVTFAISNEGDAPHNVEIEGNGIEEVSETFEPGAGGDFTVELEPGKYDFYCAVDGHKQLGMDGELTVE